MAISSFSDAPFSPLWPTSLSSVHARMIDRAPDRSFSSTRSTLFPDGRFADSALFPRLPSTRVVLVDAFVEFIAYLVAVSTMQGPPGPVLDPRERFHRRSARKPSGKPAECCKFACLVFA